MGTLGYKLMLLAAIVAVAGVALHAILGLVGAGERYRAALQRLRRLPVGPGAKPGTDAGAGSDAASMATRDVWDAFLGTVRIFEGEDGGKVAMASPHDLARLRARLRRGLEESWRESRVWAGHVVTVGFMATLSLASRAAFALRPWLMAKAPRVPVAVGDLFAAFGAAFGVMAFALAAFGVAVGVEWLWRRRVLEALDLVMDHVRAHVLSLPPSPTTRAAPVAAWPQDADATRAKGPVAVDLEPLRHELAGVRHALSALAVADPGAAVAQALRQGELRLAEDQWRALVPPPAPREFRLAEDQMRWLAVARGGEGETRELRLAEDQMRRLTDARSGDGGGREMRLADDQLRLLTMARHAPGEAGELRLAEDQMRRLTDALVGAGSAREMRLADDQLRLLTMARRDDGEARELRLAEDQMRRLTDARSGDGDGRETRFADDQLRWLANALTRAPEGPREWRMAEDQVTRLMRRADDAAQPGTVRLADDQWEALRAATGGDELREALRELVATQEESQRRWRAEFADWRAAFGDMLSAHHAEVREALAAGVAPQARAEDEGAREALAAVPVLAEQVVGIARTVQREASDWRDAWEDVARGMGAMREDVSFARRADDERLRQTDDVVRQCERMSERFLEFLTAWQGKIAHDAPTRNAPVNDPDATRVTARAADAEADVDALASREDESRRPGAHDDAPNGDARMVADPHARAAAGEAWDDEVRLPRHDDSARVNDVSSPDARNAPGAASALGADPDDAAAVGLIRLRAGVALMREVGDELGACFDGVTILREQLAALQKSAGPLLGDTTPVWFRTARRSLPGAATMRSLLKLRAETDVVLRAAWHPHASEPGRFVRRDGVSLFVRRGDDVPVLPASSLETLWRESPVPALAARAFAPLRASMELAFKRLMDAHALVEASAAHGEDAHAPVFAAAAEALRDVSRAWEAWESHRPVLARFLAVSRRRAPHDGRWAS